MAPKWLLRAACYVMIGSTASACLMMGVTFVEDMRAVLLPKSMSLVLAFVGLAVRLAFQGFEAVCSLYGEKELRIYAATASGLAAIVATLMPLMAALYIREHNAWLGVVGTASTVALLLLGCLGHVTLMIGVWVCDAVFFATGVLMGRFSH